MPFHKTIQDAEDEFFTGNRERAFEIIEEHRKTAFNRDSDFIKLESLFRDYSKNLNNLRDDLHAVAYRKAPPVFSGDERSKKGDELELKRLHNQMDGKFDAVQKNLDKIVSVAKRLFKDFRKE